MGILGKYFVQGSFAKTEIKKSSKCYQCGGIRIQVRNTQGRIYMLPMLAVFGKY